MKSFLLLLFVLFVASKCPAQSPPDSPKPKQERRFDRRVFIAGEILLAASIVADGKTTSDFLARGGSEGNRFLGLHPSNTKVTGFNLAVFTAASAGFYLTERNRRAWIRWAGRALLANMVVNRAHLAACNSSLDPYHGEPCHPIGL